MESHKQSYILIFDKQKNYGKNCFYPLYIFAQFMLYIYVYNINRFHCLNCGKSTLGKMWATEEASFKARKRVRGDFGAVPLFPWDPKNSNLNLSQL